MSPGRTVLSIQTSLKLIDCLIQTSTAQSVLSTQTSLDLDASIDWLRHRSIETSLEMQESIDYVIVLLKRHYSPIYYLQNNVRNCVQHKQKTTKTKKNIYITAFLLTLFVE